MARNIIAELIVAIEQVHQQGLTYRDLKPQNILFDQDGHLRLSEFGLMKQGFIEQPDEVAKKGYFEYKAPEVVNKQKYDKNLDWYLVGAILYKLIVGYSPYFSKDDDQMRQSILESTLLFPQSTSPQAVDLIKKLMRRDPNRRLGAGAADAKAICDHPFFKDLSWDDVREKKLEMCPIEGKRDFQLNATVEQNYYKHLR